MPTPNMGQIGTCFSNFRCQRHLASIFFINIYFKFVWNGSINVRLQMWIQIYICVQIFLTIKVQALRYELTTWTYIVVVWEKNFNWYESINLMVILLASLMAAHNISEYFCQEKRLFITVSLLECSRL